MQPRGLNVASRQPSNAAQQCMRARLCMRAQRRVRAAAAPRQVVLEAGVYEEIVDKLAAQVIRETGRRPRNRKYIVGIAGAPGSGKTTLAQLLCGRINALLAERGEAPAGGGGGAPLCAVVPMDGFHYYRRQLDAMPDPQEAHARRGAHWTFDAEAFVACIRRIREEGAALVPSFDHGVGDPVEDDITVDQATRIVLVEGNYLLLDEEPWRQLRRLFDETVFVSCPVDVAMARVFDRQVAIGLAPEVSRDRIAGNDRPNAELVAATEGAARVVVPSVVPFGGGGSGSSSDAV